MSVVGASPPHPVMTTVFAVHLMGKSPMDRVIGRGVDQ
jgi:hypothetical protein